MTDQTCEQLQDLLVDYADAALPADQHAEVKRHLDGCPRCRTLAAALSRSANLAQTVWQEAHADLSRLQLADIRPRRGARLIRLSVPAAAAILILVLGALAWRSLLVSHPQPWPAPSAPVRELALAAPPLTPDQVRREVEHAGNSAAILASVEWLAERPGTRQIAREQYEFLIRMYPDRPLARQAQARLAALDQRRS